MFWHQPREGVDRTTYEAALVAFHTALRDIAPSGFHRSLALHLNGASWMGRESDGYEDWYLVENTGALETLNRAAVSDVLVDAHDGSARHAAWGAAGLYQPFGNELDGLDATTALWFSKPSGMSYEAMSNRLERAEPGLTNRVSQRFMTLGPTPEFCLLGRGVDALPYGWQGELVVRRKLF